MITSIGAMMGPLDSTIVSVSLPVIAESLAMDYASIIWVPTAYLVTLTVLLLSLGRLSDMRGRKPIFVSGFAIFTLGSLLCSLSQSGQELIAFRIVQAVGGACMMSTSSAIITDVFPSSERGKALGINAMAVYIGLSLGPALGGILTYAFGWQSIFLVNIPIGVAVIILASLKFKESIRAERKEKFDVSGTLAFSAGLVSLLVAMTLGEECGWTSLFILSLIGMAAVLLSVFVLIEVRKGQSAMFDISLITKNRLFTAANLSALLNYTSYFGVAFVISFYLQRVLGYSILQTGLILLVMPVTMAVLSPISGWASDRIGSRYLSSGGMVLISLGLLLLSTLDSSSTTLPIVIYLFIIGLGMGIFSSPNTSAVMGCVERRQLGVAGGTLATMRTLGQSLSLAVMGAVISTVASTAVVSSLFSGSNPSQIMVDSTAFVQGMTYAFLVSAGIAALGAVTSYARGPSVPVVCDATNHSQKH